MDLREYLVRLTQRVAALSRLQRSMVIVMGSAVILALVFMQFGRNEPAYAPLFTGLDPRDAGAVLEQLKASKVSYQLANQGATILVPADVVYELRLQLANQGILAPGGVGFELFDRSQLGVTDFERQLNFQRALQEELRRTIVQLEEVEQARLHLVIPQPSVFIREQQAASASVVVKLRPLARLQPQQIKGIIWLVAGSVEGLAPENVTIIDTTGNILSQQVVFDEGGVGTSQMQMGQREMRDEFEQNIERRIRGMLERVFGPGQVAVMVTAELDFNQREVTIIDYADAGVIRSEREITETGTGGQLPQGPVGDLNRGPDIYQDAVTGAGSNLGSYDRQDTTRNYEIDQTQERVVYTPGKLLNLSTAVALNVPMTAASEDQARQIIAAAVGYQPERGDQISVISMAFDTSLADAASEDLQPPAAQPAQAGGEIWWKQAQNQLYLRYGLGLLALVGLFAWLWRRRLARKAQWLLEEQVMAETVVMVEPAVIEEEVRRPSPEEVRRRSRQERAKEVTVKQPDEVAQLLKAWLTED